MSISSRSWRCTASFTCIPETLFFRRYHEQSSSWNRTDDSHQRKYYAPEQQGDLRRPHVAQVRGTLSRHLARADLVAREDRVCRLRLARMAAWDREHLGRELIAAFQSRK